MKSEIIETVVPEQIKKSVCYTCENCGAKYNRTSPFDECAICGREICTKCKQLLYLVEDYLSFDRESPASIDFDTEDNPGV